MPILTKFTELLLCTLTDDEIRAKGEELAACVDQIETEEASRKQAMDAAKAKIDDLENQRDRLARQVNTKSEQREIECEDVVVYDDGMVRTMRKDTNEVVRQRIATEGELLRQPTLFDGGEEKTDPETPAAPEAPDPLGLGPTYQGGDDGPAKPPTPENLPPPPDVGDGDKGPESDSEPGA